METAKPRKLGRGLSALLGEPVAISLPAGGSSEGTKARGHEATEGEAQIKPLPAAATDARGSSDQDRKSGGGEARTGAIATARLAGPAAVRPVAPDASVADAAAIPAPEGEDHGMRVVMVGVEEVVAGRFQPRREFAEAELKELSDSIKAAGLVQPILVRPISVDHWSRPAEEWAGRTPEVPPAGEARAKVRYELVAGERRWRATKLAGVTHIPAVVRVLSDEQAAEWGLIENIQRTDLNVMEKARAVKSLCSRFGLTHGRVAEKLGIDRSSAANLARLADIEEPVAQALERGEITAGHAKAMLALGRTERIAMTLLASTQGWSVRKVEEQVERILKATQSSVEQPTAAAQAQRPRTAPAMAELERQLSDHLGTNVKIRAKPDAKRGSLVIKFYDLDHFDGLMGKMGFRME